MMSQSCWQRSFQAVVGYFPTHPLMNWLAVWGFDRSSGEKTTPIGWRGEWRCTCVVCALCDAEPSSPLAYITEQRRNIRELIQVVGAAVLGAHSMQRPPTDVGTTRAIFLPHRARLPRVMHDNTTPPFPPTSANNGREHSQPVQSNFVFIW